MKGTLNSRLIAVVDDDESIREATANLLKALGFTAQTFSSAEEFLNSTRLYDTACMVLDIQLPGMNGLELQRRLAVRDHLIPIIFITAHGNKGLELRARRRGAIDFLSKPFSAADLLRAIHAVLDTPKTKEHIEPESLKDENQE